MAKEKTVKTKRKGGGGKLARTENVQVRLDPKLRYAAELAAQKHRRTLSSFIEWCVQEAVGNIVIGLEPNESVNHVVAKTWDQREPVRFLLKALYYPYLLSYEEEKLWTLIWQNRVYWVRPWAYDSSWTKEEFFEWVHKNCHTQESFKKNLDDFDETRLVAQYPVYQTYAKGEIDLKELDHILKNGDWDTKGLIVGGENK